MRGSRITWLRFSSVSKSGAGEKRVLCVMSAMNSRRSIGSRALLILACVCAISTSTVAQARLPLGRVVVKRDPGFGWNLAFDLQIDGRSVARSEERRVGKEGM